MSCPTQDIVPFVRRIKNPTLHFAMLASMVLSWGGNAQTLPFQASQRFEYGSRIGQQALPPGTVLEPRLDSGIQYANNINLEETDTDDAFGIEVAPGIYASHSTERFVGALDYSLIGRLWDDGDLDDVTQRLAANGRWTALREVLFIDAEASYDDAVIDFANGANYGGLGIFDNSNIVEQAAASIGPTVRKRFKDFQFEASYSYGQVWILDRPEDFDQSFGQVATDDSVDQSANVSFGLVPGNSRLNGSVFYSWENSEFDNALPYEFERAGLEGGYELSRTLTLVGDVGKESQLDEDASAGGLDSDFWSAGLRWSPDSRTSVEGRYGDRFFGSSYSVEVSHSSRLLEITASYAEAPQVDTRRRSLGRFEPGDLPPGLDQGLENSALNSQPYIGKDGSISLISRGSRTLLGISAFTSDRDYIDDFIGDEEGSGVRLFGSRSLAANLSVDLQASYTDYFRGQTVVGPVVAFEQSNDYDTEITLRGNRDFGPKLVGSLEAGYFHRAGTNKYDGWWVGLRGRWYPDFGK